MAVGKACKAIWLQMNRWQLWLRFKGDLQFLRPRYPIAGQTRGTIMPREVLRSRGLPTKTESTVQVLINRHAECRYTLFILLVPLSTQLQITNLSRVNLAHK